MNNNWKAACLCDFGMKEIYIKKGGKLIKAENANPEELKKQLLENRDHLVAFIDEANVHPRLDFPIWPFQEKIIIYVLFPMEEPEEKGIAV